MLDAAHQVGVMESRQHDDDVLGLERVLNHLQSLAAWPSIEDVARSLVEWATEFGGGVVRADIVVVALQAGHS